MRRRMVHIPVAGIIVSGMLKGRTVPATTVTYIIIMAIKVGNIMLPVFLYNMTPSVMAMGICIQTGNTDEGYILNITAITRPKMAITMRSAKKTIMKNAYFTLLFIIWEVVSAMETPLFLMDTTSEPKSWTAPITMDPIRIHSIAGTQPQIIPIAGPTIGPVPAMDV